MMTKRLVLLFAGLIYFSLAGTQFRSFGLVAGWLLFRFALALGMDHPYWLEL